jgi:tetratricopeptide (TPR) repeat protein
MKNNMNETPKTKSGWRIPRRVLITLAILATLIAIFYTEEDWRGKRAWENCKRELVAKGIVLDWDKFIPPPVPDGQNFFTASTNILLRFKKAQTDAESEMASKCSWLRIIYSTNSFPVFDTAKTRPLVVAEMTVEPPTVASPAAGGSHAFVVKLNAANAREQILGLIRTTVGRGILGAAGFQFSELQLSNLAPAQIVLQSDTLPSVADLENLIPEGLVTNVGHLRIEAASDKKTFQVLMTGVHVTAAADYLKWSDQFEPAFDEIREALKRPYAIIPGDYSQPFLIPIPNFVTMRSVAQTLAQRAQCYLLLGQMDKALREVTLMHDVCRILERPPAGKPITLVEAMINVAIMGLYTSTVADGFRLQAWQEPQLAALQEQLKKVNLLPQVAAAFESESAAVCFTLINSPPSVLANQRAIFFGTSTNLLQKLKDPEFDFLTFAPHGWVYQNVVVHTTQMQKGIKCYDLANQLIFPKTTDEWDKQVQSFNKWNPYFSLGATFLPKLTKATQTLAHNQTLVNEAQIVCALERYRLAHGQYPETLDALTPQFVGKIPHDIIGGQPLHYRRTEGGKFLLYSIGWNETDDGGQVALKKDGSEDREKGDWVWQYPLK